MDYSTTAYSRGSYSEPTNKQLDKQLWMVDDLPIEEPSFLTRTQVREYLEFHCSGLQDIKTRGHTSRPAKSFTVLYIDKDGKQKRNHCCALTLGRHGPSAGPDIDPWKNGDQWCIVVDRETPYGSTTGNYPIIEFNMNMVISIVTCERFIQIANRATELENHDSDDDELDGCGPPMMPALDMVVNN